jgi:hypothetical protein
VNTIDATEVAAGQVVRFATAGRRNRTTIKVESVEVGGSMGPLVWGYRASASGYVLSNRLACRWPLRVDGAYPVEVLAAERS